MIYFSYTLLALFSIFENSASILPKGNTKNIKIVFSSESKMYFTGSTNLQRFKCDCPTPQEPVPIIIDYKNGDLHFENSKLPIITSKIDCHHSIYNQNIQKTLQSDKNPSILIHLIDIWKTNMNTTSSSNQWFDVISNTDLTICQKTKNFYVQGKAIKLCNNKYRVKGYQILSMKEFEVPVPAFLFGLVQFNDIIQFNFDLIFEVIQ